MDLALFAIGLVVALRGTPAHAAGSPLLVVVEAPPDLEMDAGEVRRAIGAELGEPTIAPSKVARDWTSRALVVAVDRQRITMSLRDSETEPIVRAVASPPERAARLRVIAWLAGNLARDQVTSVVAEPARPEPAAPAAEPPPAPAAPVDPPRFEALVPTVVSRAEPGVAGPAKWTLGVAIGPAVSLDGIGHPILYLSELRSSDATTIWRVEARRQSAASRTFTGLALEGGWYTPKYGGELVGALALAGAAGHLGKWTFAASAGAGIDLDRKAEPKVDFIGTNGGLATIASVSYVLMPGLFGAASLSLAYQLSESFEAALGLDVHVSAIDDGDNYLAATLGLRHRL